MTSLATPPPDSLDANPAAFDDVTHSVTRSPRGPARLLRDRLLRAAEGIVDGHLELQLPDGTVHRFGPVDHDRRARLHVRSDQLWQRLLLRGRLGPGEAWVDGLWDSDDPATVLEVLARTQERRRGARARTFDRLVRLRPHLPRRNDARRARHCIERHYDLGNDLFEAFLDPTMTYSCAVFEHSAQTLEQAQVAKYERICRKLKLQPGMRVLEIGCGWGGFAMHAASTHGVHVTGVTLSRRQHELATERVRAAGLQDLVDLRLADYRTLDGTWDRIASIEMFEAIGEREFERYFATVDQLLADGGIACVQTIAVPDQRWETYRRTTDWIQRYVFPGGLLPSLEAMNRSMRRSSTLLVHDLEEIGIHYARTLGEWRDRLLAQREELTRRGYDARFQRTWEYYLAFCEAGFRARLLRDLQVVLARPGTDALDPVRAA